MAQEQGNKKENKPLKILFVAMGNSLHTFRWIKQIKDQNWEVRLFSSYDIPGTPDPFIDADWCTVVGRRSKLFKIFYLFADSLRHPRGYSRAFINGTNGNFIKYLHGRLGLIPLAALAQEIAAFQPDIIHTMHSQTSGYLVASIRKRWRTKFPLWIHSMWGSDVYFHIRVQEQREKLTEMFSLIDGVIAEGKRDRSLVTSLGFNGYFYPSMPVTNGFEVNKLEPLHAVAPSQRKRILVKGYQDVVGRFYVALRALELCANEIKERGYEVHVVSAKDEGARINAEIFGNDYEIPVHIHEFLPSHDDVMKLQSSARISMAISTSDGVPAFFLEALAAGSFPIQSNTAIADEWVENGKSGFLVPPNDPDVIAKSLREALINDVLVDQAASINLTTIKERLSSDVMQKRIKEIYEYASTRLDNLSAV